MVGTGSFSTVVTLVGNVLKGRVIPTHDITLVVLCLVIGLSFQT